MTNLLTRLRMSAYDNGHDVPSVVEFCDATAAFARETLRTLTQKAGERE